MNVIKVQTWSETGLTNFVVFCVSLQLLHVAAGQSLDDAATRSEQPPEDLWAKLTSEDWQPGRVGEFNTTFPLKDLECEGTQTRMVSDPLLTWADVKDRMHKHLTEPMDDRWLLQVAMQIQKDEPDSCVLGVTSTSAYLLPVTMPKFRNMARMLNEDCNFLILNVTFYDTLRSGFPIFGILDGLASAEFRAWFQTDEGLSYFPGRRVPATCHVEPVRVLRERIEAHRTMQRPRALLIPSVDVFLAGDDVGRPEAAGGCPLAKSAALISYALSRAEGPRPAGSEAVYAALRDVIEMVSRAEELVRSHSWDDGVAFGQLVATPWNIWWLLHRLQLALPRLLSPHSNWRGLRSDDTSTAEL